MTQKVKVTIGENFKIHFEQNVNLNLEILNFVLIFNKINDIYMDCEINNIYMNSESKTLRFQLILKVKNSRKHNV